MAYVISDDCIACGTCIDECPVGAISEGDKYSINPDICTECGTCADVCPSEAITRDNKSTVVCMTTNTTLFLHWRDSVFLCLLWCVSLSGNGEWNEKHSWMAGERKPCCY